MVKSRRGYREALGLCERRRGKKNALVMQKFHNIPPQFHPRLLAEAKRTLLNDPKPPGPEPRVDRLTTTGREFLKILFRYASRSASVCDSSGPRDRQVERERERETNHRLGASSSEKKVVSIRQTYPIQEAAGPEDHFPPERRMAAGERDRDKTNPVRTPLASLVPSRPSGCETNAPSWLNGEGKKVEKNKKIKNHPFTSEGGKKDTREKQMKETHSAE